MKYTIPLKLVSEANNSEHYRIKAKRRRGQKFIIKSYIKKEDIPKSDLLHIILTRHTNLSLDSHDNLPMAFKGIVDAVSEIITGCKTAGRGDDDQRLRWKYAQEKIPASQPPYITIEIIDLTNNVEAIKRIEKEYQEKLEKIYQKEREKDKPVTGAECILI